MTFEIPIGERIRFYRGRRRQVDVAMLAHVSVDYLSEIERGRKMPAIPVVYRLAEILGVPIAALLGEPSLEPGEPGGPAVIPRMRMAMLGWTPPAGVAPDLPALRERVTDSFVQWRQRVDNYSTVSAELPELIAEIEQATRWFRTPGEVAQRQEAQSIAALLYIFLATWFQEIKRYDLCMLAADRAERAAELADDDQLVRATQFRVAHALLAVDEKDGAEELALKVAEELQNSEDRHGVGLHGALNLVAAMAACRSGDLHRARQLIQDEAFPAARQTGESDSYWTSFGPANVGVYAMTIETERGGAPEAIALGNQVEIDDLPTIIRKANFLLDLGKAHERERDDLGLFFYLGQLEAVAPEWARYNPVVRNMVRTLVKRGRPSSSQQFRAMARRLRVAV